MMDEAEHGLGLRRPFDLGARETAMLHAVAEAAAGEEPARVFEYLCSRAFDGGSRTGLAVTPPELAELMLDLAGDKTSRLLDPACGSGTILLAAARRGYTRVEGQEQDGSLTLVTALRLPPPRPPPGPRVGDGHHPARRRQARLHPCRRPGTGRLTDARHRAAARARQHRVLRRPRPGLPPGGRVPASLGRGRRVQSAVRGPQLGPGEAGS